MAANLLELGSVLCFACFVLCGMAAVSDFLKGKL